MTNYKNLEKKKKGITVKYCKNEASEILLEIN
jgi:hypothetical protein